MVDQIGFYCQEDYRINRTQLLDIINDNPSVFSDAKSQNFENYLMNLSSTQITYLDYYSFYHDIDDYELSLERTINNNSNRCLIGNGSDLGCCGNYSGCCYWWSHACLIHDVLCSDCSPALFCGWQCQPEP